MYMQEYTPTLEIQVKSNKGQCGILIFVEAFRWTLKLHLFIFVFEWLKHCIDCSFSTMWMQAFFITLCYTKLSQKFNWQVTLFSQAARAMKILQQKEYAYVLCNSIVWKCPVFYVHDFICEMQGLKHFMQLMKSGSGAVPFQFHILLATLKLELNCPIKIPFKTPQNTCTCRNELIVPKPD